MKKLNNKGFAISTLLYGILMIALLILTVILSIMRSSYMEKTAMSEDTLRYMNKCATKLASLNYCYKTYNSGSTTISCAEEYEAYTKCMGYDNDTTSMSVPVIIKSFLLDYSDVSDTGLREDISTEENRYVYTGANPDNYIKIGNTMGRIISIESNGSIKILLNTTIDDVSFDTKSSVGEDYTESTRWEDSVLNNKLKSKFNTLDYTSKMRESTFNVANVPSSEAMTYRNLVNLTATQKYSGKYGLITIDDYIKASANAHKDGTKCYLAGTSSQAITKFEYSTTVGNCGEKNWLASSTSELWTMTPAGDLDTYYTINNKKLSTKAYNQKADAKMVIYLSEKTTIATSGLGTQSKPFVVDIK